MKNKMHIWGWDQDSFLAMILQHLLAFTGQRMFEALIEACCPRCSPTLGILAFQSADAPQADRAWNQLGGRESLVFSS